jgi:MFS family permease
MISGVGWALDNPSRRSLILDLVGRSGVTNGVALDSVAMSAGITLGPALAGALIDLSGVAGGYLAVTAFYAVSVVLLLRLHPPRVPRPRGGITAALANLAVGLRFVASHRTLIATVVVTLNMNLLLFPYMHVVPVIARDVLNVGPGLMGLLQAAAGLGTLAGAVAVASAASIDHHGRLYAGGAMLALLALLGFAASPWYLISVPMLVALGLGVAGFSTMQPTIVMLVSREEMRGTALGVISLAIGVGPLGALLVGGVASATSAPTALGLNAAAGIVLLAVTIALMPSLLGRIVPAGGRQDGWDTTPARIEGPPACQ